ncbi:hypothetical protein OKA05_02065 [Luteolibacter arcticus]|uniref:Glycosyltransferase n=1 Tax=Luteolibacter arcticus TaxID=1581411 RepID=A0ABT3GDH9_9BACT|nr:hypothetical protein [Luteolibacter arcticus]MCW1921318.1 hypothetical protein [Luteolibacter arcticus]
MKAFIFSSGPDREAAAMCHRRLGDLGVSSVVALDRQDAVDLRPWEIATSFPRGRRLKGSACAIGIAELMAGEQGTVCKVDADMLLSRAGVEWLASTAEHAHGYSLKASKVRWTGCWSATSEVMAEVAEKLAAFPPCNDCGESNLMHAAFKATCGIRRFPLPVVQVWRAGRLKYHKAHVVTLPSGLPAVVRTAELRDLFGV